MKKTLIGVIVTMAVVFCLAGVASAKATTVKIFAVKGQITAVDATANTLSVKNAKGAVVDLVLDANTKVTGKAAAVADLKVGDKVTVKYKKDSGKNIATTIVTPKK